MYLLPIIISYVELQQDIVYPLGIAFRYLLQTHLPIKYSLSSNILQSRSVIYLPSSDKFAVKWIRVLQNTIWIPLKSYKSVAMSFLAHVRIYDKKYYFCFEWPNIPVKIIIFWSLYLEKIQQHSSLCRRTAPVYGSTVWNTSHSLLNFEAHFSSILRNERARGQFFNCSDSPALFRLPENTEHRLSSLL